MENHLKSQVDLWLNTLHRYFVCMFWAISMEVICTPKWMMCLYFNDFSPILKEREMICQSRCLVCSIRVGWMHALLSNCMPCSIWYQCQSSILFWPHSYLYWPRIVIIYMLRQDCMVAKILVWLCSFSWTLRLSWSNFLVLAIIKMVHLCFGKVGSCDWFGIEKWTWGRWCISK